MERAMDRHYIYIAGPDLSGIGLCLPENTTSF